MNELLQNIPDLNNTGVLIVSGILGAVFAYFQKWAWSGKESGGMLFYLFGDKKAVARASTKLIGALAVAITVDMQSSMDFMQVVILGVGIGLATPEKVEQQENKIEQSEEFRGANVSTEN
jgi:hypothetical protein